MVLRLRKSASAWKTSDPLTDITPRLKLPRSRGPRLPIRAPTISTWPEAGPTFPVLSPRITLLALTPPSPKQSRALVPPC